MKNCNHEWKEGYTLEPIIFCAKCNIDLEDVYGLSIYKDLKKLQSIKL
jgi:hypothetical protein